MPKALLSELPADTDPGVRSNRLLLWERALVPLRHAERAVTFEGSWEKARVEMLCALEDNGSIVVLAGKRGCGKTQLSVEAAKTYCRSGYSTLYVKAVDLFLSIREGMGDGEKSERAILAKYLQPALLVIDALEERGETEWENRMFCYILDRRYDAMRDTLLVTNQLRQRFAESVGLSVVSRINECGKFIECTWDTFRTKRAALAVEEA